METTKIYYGRKDGQIAYETSDAYMTVWSIMNVSDDQDIEEVLDYLRTVAGKPIPSCPKFSWSGDESYRTKEGRDHVRALLLLPAKVEVEVRTKADVTTTQCTCGHICPTDLVMSATRGPSCPDCYDEMSN